MRIFDKTDILIPQNVDMGKWACVACDQYTSEPEYWEAVENIVSEVPSTLRMMLPEAYLETRDNKENSEMMYSYMNKYLANDVFKCYEDSLIYVERTLESGLCRLGLVGAIDLDCYDWAEGTNTPVRATEGTIESRLPTRVNIRIEAPIEMPHIMVFINDPSMEIIPSAKGGEVVYDFDLMQRGGHIMGSLVSDTEAVLSKLDAMSGSITYAMGDGNHSLAAAKKTWEKIKENLTEEEKMSHPAKYALVELVNIHDEAVTIEPIHRLVFGTVAETFVEKAMEVFPASETGKEILVKSGEVETKILVPNVTIGELVDMVENFCKAYIADNGGEIDYIHGDDTTLKLGAKPNSGVVLIPAMDKSEVFSSVEKSGPFPRKSFSIGHAQDKRYYLECRKIVK